MKFEKVHTIRDIYDGIRTGTADLGGAPHYFAAVFDDDIGDYTQGYRLCSVSAQFMERELRWWAIYRRWEAKFHRGLEPLETHPGHGGIIPEYDELREWLEEQVRALTPISLLYTATFRALPDRTSCPLASCARLRSHGSPHSLRKETRQSLLDMEAATRRLRRWCTVWRPSLAEVEAAARVLHKAGLHHHWWEPCRKSYDELAESDPIGKEEFDGIVEQMLMAAHEVGSSN
jgi:hypothetical protein